MSNENTTKSGWQVAGEILGATLAAVGAVGAVAGIGYLAKEAAEEAERQAEKNRKEKKEFLESVDARLNTLNELHTNIGLIKQQMVKEEVARLLDIQSSDKRKHYDRLNELFDELIAEKDVRSVVEATRERDKLLEDLKKPTVNPASFNGAISYDGMMRQQLYTELMRLNAEYKDANWNIRDNIKHIKKGVYQKLQSPPNCTRDELYHEMKLLQQLEDTAYSRYEEQDFCNKVRKVIVEQLAK
jgi:hypothetical protein